MKRNECASFYIESNQKSTVLNDHNFSKRDLEHLLLTERSEANSVL